MLLTITLERSPATDLSWLLHKHPAKVQTFGLAFGQAHVFYPEAGEQRTTAALLLEIDPLELTRRRRGPGSGFSLQEYINDRPYVASSFISVAIAQVFGSALGGRCADRPELVDEPLPLQARIAVLSCRGGEIVLRQLFEPLGYEVQAEPHPLDPKFPEWGASSLYTVSLRGTKLLRDLLRHLYVLIPVLDDEKHYWVGPEEVDKLLHKGEGWLADHPHRGLITRRYLKHRWALAREALARLADEDHPDPDLEAVEHGLEEDALEADVVFNGAPPPAPAPAVTGPAPEAAAPPDELPPDCGEPDTEEPRPPGLHTLRLGTVLAVLRSSGARSVVDLGCGEGRLLRLLLNEPQFERIVGLDASVRALQLAARRLKLEHLPGGKRRRIELLHGALTYRDARLSGFEAAACVEVIEHLDLPRLAAFERVLFECARPRTVVLTTPNREYNALFETLPAGHLRHRDHRFEWTREECAAWAETVGRRHGYHVRFLPIGPMDAAAGAPSQMAIFELHA